MSNARRLLAALSMVALAGCQSMPQPVKVDFSDSAATTPVPSARVATPMRSNGSLFQSASYRPAFEDPRARLVGDVVTVQIAENVTASQVSKSTANRTSSLSTGVTAFPFLNSTTTSKFSTGATSANDFAGKGGTESANTFNGVITATVTEVLPNGHLLIAGEKQIGVNQNVDVMRFTGSVDPALLQPGNLINSTQVANVRLESRGRGAQAEAQTAGWLTRFFFSVLPF